MKKIFHFIAPAALVAFALVSCQEETFVPEEQGEVNITVKAVPQDFANETRTYIDNTNTIIWGTGEYMKIAVQAGNNTNFADSKSSSADAFNGDSEAMFEFSITTPEGGAPYTHMGLYPKSAAVSNSNTNVAAYKVELPDVQNATAASYDPAAYIMVAKPEPFDEVQTLWEASYRRATALNKVTLKGLDADIVSVQFVFPSTKDVAGRRYINLSTGESGEVYYPESDNNVIEVRYSTALAANSGADKTIWFTSWETLVSEGEQITIVAKSASKSYTKTITANANGIRFKEGYLNTLGVSMAGIEGEDLVDYSGKYLIGAYVEDKWILMDPDKGTDKFYPSLGTSVSTAIASIKYSDFSGVTDIDDYVWEAAKYAGAYSLQSDNTGLYLALTKSANEAHSADELSANSKFYINVDATTSVATIESAAFSGRQLKYNSGSPRFAFYTSGQQSVYLIPATPKTPHGLSYTTTSFSVKLGDSFTAPTLNNPNNLTVTYESSNTTAVDVNENTGAVTIKAVGTATITASFAGNDTYRAGSASYTIVVSEPVSLEGWVETDLASIVAGDVFVIVGNNGSNYAMSNDKGASSAPEAVPVTVSKGKITSTVANRIKWNLTVGNGSYVFYPVGVTNEWLYTTTSNNGLRVGGTNEHKNIVLDDGYMTINDGSDTRYIGVYNNADWRSYTSINSNISGQTFMFYKYYDDGKVDANVSYSPASAEVAWNATLTQPTLTKPEGLAVTYASSDSGVATVSSAGVIAPVKPGSATITVSWIEQTVGSTTYREGSTTFALTVKKAVATVAFNNPVTTVAVEGTQTNLATPNPSTLTVTYSSNNPAAATVNATTGEVTGVANGSAIITATVGDEYYETATATYTMTVGSGGPQAQWEVVTDFSSIVSGDKYMFVNVQSGNSYYMSTQTCSVGNGTNCVKLSSLPTAQGFVTDNNMILILTGNATDGYIASNLEGKELFIKNTNNGLGFVAKGTSVKFYSDNSVSGYTLSGYDDAGTPVLRYIGMNGTTNFRCYTSVNTNVKTGEYVWYHYIGN